MMTMNGRLGLLLALAAGVVLGSVIARDRREERHRAERRKRKQELHSWEGEGGSLATQQHGR
jgi:uncharacterized membrane protein affecting hemolysin expression